VPNYSAFRKRNASRVTLSSSTNAVSFSSSHGISSKSPAWSKAFRASLTKANSVLLRLVNSVTMNKLVASFLITVAVALPICSAPGQVATGTPSVTVQAISASSPQPNEHPKAGKKTKEVSASDVQEKTWASEVWFPIVQFLGIAVIIGFLLWFIDLPTFLQGDAWSARTVIALILVFSFAAAP
jgi:hypothetical protein